MAEMPIFSNFAHIDLTVAQLVEYALKNNEGQLTDQKALCVQTGKRTGRSPKDRFIVKDAQHQSQIDWGNINQAISPEVFERIWQKATTHIGSKEHFISHLFVGAEPKHQVMVRVITELAWHNLFAKQLFIRPEQPSMLQQQDGWTILNVPSLRLEASIDQTHSEAFVGLDFSHKRILICGTAYAGEMKKGMFSVLNYLLPEKQILPMHCSANVGEGGDVALFFGLSGTGKTTLSADPERYLIGDDEHGWGDEGVFNFEGGCYAKCINLSEKNEPMIWNAIRDGAVVENVVLDEHGKANYDDDSLTENTRAAYPLEYISPRFEANRAGQPNAVIFLTCDLFGVLPPVSLLNKEQAAYHFLSGYTALVGSTEVGSATGIQPTFSTCFGAPFFPRPPKVYAELLIERLERSGAQVYLVNTGWTGGPYGVGQRFSIPTTRAVIQAILKGDVLKAPKQMIAGFNLQVPTALPQVESKLLNPIENWADTQDFQNNLSQLMKLFAENFKRFDVPAAIRDAGPLV